MIIIFAKFLLKTPKGFLILYSTICIIIPKESNRIPYVFGYSGNTWPKEIKRQ